MLYLLDASVFITANNSYYAIDRVPEFWEWLNHMANIGHVKVPREIYEEIKDGPKDAEKDLLYAWIQKDANHHALVLSEDVDSALVRRAVTTGYAPDLSDDEIEQLGRDPFLLAYAMAQLADRCIVTVEVSKPRCLRQNRRLPDVCKTLGVRCCDTFALNRELGFRTGWKEPD